MADAGYSVCWRGTSKLDRRIEPWQEPGGCFDGADRNQLDALADTDHLELLTRLQVERSPDVSRNDDLVFREIWDSPDTQLDRSIESTPRTSGPDGCPRDSSQRGRPWAVRPRGRGVSSGLGHGNAAWRVDCSVWSRDLLRFALSATGGRLRPPAPARGNRP